MATPTSVNLGLRIVRAAADVAGCLLGKFAGMKERRLLGRNLAPEDGVAGRG
jgi:hypothetical protein